MATTYTQRTYTESDRSKKRKEQLEAQEAARPGAYESQWLPQLDAAMGQILNREDFQYDLNTDPLYRQYRDNYVNQGQMAMMDTLGQAATLTGGYGNSYAQLAAQQAYQSHLQELGEITPQLYQLALDAYDRQGQAMLNRYGILSDREALDYGRYNDALGLWADQLDYLAGRYDAERGFDYTAFRDMVADDQWLAAFQEDIRRYELAHQPKVSYGGGGGGNSGSGRTKKKEEEEEKKTQSTSSYAPHIVIPNRTKPHLYTDENY